MTGIERLRELIKDYRSGHECEGIECGELSCGECIAKNVLEPIATQIEREHAEDCYRMVLDYGTVSRVASEMERHVLGHEGMEDSPVARWARELREALDGCADEADGDREAVAWVREHGGIEALCRTFHDADNCRVELCAALGIDLDKGWSDAMVAMRRRLMPEGMEDMIASYPRFEDGTLALPGMEAVANSGQRSGEAFTIKKAWLENGTWHLSDSTSDGHYWHFKHKDPVVRRPAPKVLDADGVEIRVGDKCYVASNGDGPYVVDYIRESDGAIDMYWHENKNESLHIRPDLITHRAPVLAADGKPLCVGETVWGTKGGSYHLTSVHDGKVFARHVGGSFGAEVESAGGEGLYRLRADQLTHERPAVDTWERLEEDATIDPRAYCSKHRLYIDPYDGDSAPAIEKFARDIVRRAKRLAERGQ